MVTELALKILKKSDFFQVFWRNNVFPGEKLVEKHRIHIQRPRKHKFAKSQNGQCAVYAGRTTKITAPPSVTHN